MLSKISITDFSGNNRTQRLYRHRKAPPRRIVKRRLGDHATDLRVTVLIAGGKVTVLRNAGERARKRRVYLHRQEAKVFKKKNQSDLSSPPGLATCPLLRGLAFQASVCLLDAELTHHRLHFKLYAELSGEPLHRRWQRCRLLARPSPSPHLRY